MLGVLNQLANSVRTLVAHEGFSTWLSVEKAVGGDYIVLNSSFLNRKDVQTPQSACSLLLTLDAAATPEPLPQVVTDFAIRTDFKLPKRGSKTLPTPVQQSARDHSRSSTRWSATTRTGGSRLLDTRHSC